MISPPGLLFFSVPARKTAKIYIESVRINCTKIKTNSGTWQKRTSIGKCSIPSRRTLYQKLDACNNGLPLPK
ncbi:hypothetical protein MSLAZ_3048 [Methanosarcina lacustris Z-7289]|uniref:Uncharacterized protein n=1 Tax=Methanosarcina lacustris Z-7289 TaxID=1434111 RepID=A0A0E3S5C8_9EURY|nr:hypothetical protein [Methanosarcina lacustris]AKB76309.1 hypothetical protein MSLAZ_3048 [Methanosarcina lacustris Z-7289]